MRSFTNYVAICFLLGATTVAFAQNPKTTHDNNPKATHSDQSIVDRSRADYGQNPKDMEDDSRVSISGTAINTTPDSFKLDYGQGTINVEMDDSEWFDQKYKALEGQRVTVYGRVDDDWLQRPEIEATSVYAPKLNTYFYSDSGVENDYFNFGFDNDTEMDNTITIVGRVTNIDGDEFTVNRGISEITVNTDELNYNPFDETGFQRLQVGDRVRVTGNLDDGLFQNREINADWIVTLEERSGSRQQQQTGG